MHSEEAYFGNYLYLSLKFGIIVFLLCFSPFQCSILSVTYFTTNNPSMGNKIKQLLIVLKNSAMQKHNILKSGLAAFYP